MAPNFKAVLESVLFDNEYRQYIFRGKATGSGDSVIELQSIDNESGDWKGGLRCAVGTFFILLKAINENSEELREYISEPAVLAKIGMFSKSFNSSISRKSSSNIV